MATPDVHHLVGAYVLDAVEPDQRAVFEEHLGSCPTCRVDLTALRRAAARLSGTTVEGPPSGLWDRVLTGALRTPQLAPAAPRPRHVAPVPRRRLLMWAAAAAAVVGGAVAAVLNRGRGESAPTAAEVFAAADARVRTVTTARGSVRVGASLALGRVAVDISAMQAPGPGRSYQLWLVPPTGTPESLAILGSAHSATAPIGDGSIAVTLGPAGGSRRPTTEPLFAVPVADL